MREESVSSEDSLGDAAEHNTWHSPTVPNEALLGMQKRVGIREEGPDGIEAPKTKERPTSTPDMGQRRFKRVRNDGRENAPDQKASPAVSEPVTTPKDHRAQERTLL